MVVKLQNKAIIPICFTNKWYANFGQIHTLLVDLLEEKVFLA